MEFEVESNGVDEEKALIYAWDIIDQATGELKDRYVGKASGGAGRPRKQYRRNVNRMIAGRHYRLNKPLAFRAVHIALAAAVQSGDRIVLKFIRNIAANEDINKVEREQIVLLGATPNKI